MYNILINNVNIELYINQKRDSLRYHHRTHILVKEKILKERMFGKRKTESNNKFTLCFSCLYVCMVKQYGLNLFCNHLEKLLMYPCIFPYLWVKG